MELVRLGFPKDGNIVSRNKFIANEILPIAFKPTAVKNKFLALFIVTQDIDESCIYLQFVISVEDGFELDYIKCHELNIVNIKENPEALEIYKNMVKNMNSGNLYAIDFIMDNLSDYPTYYHASAIRAIDDTHASVLDLFFNREYFIRIKLYLLRLINAGRYHNLVNKPELAFTDTRFNNIEFVSIEKIKHDATARVITGNGILNINHYTMWCGPSVYKMNYLSPIDKDHTSIPLSNPLGIELYNAFYSKHTFVAEFIVFDDYIFILYECIKPNTDEKIVKALKISKELINKTNFIDYNNIIYEKSNCD